MVLPTNIDATYADDGSDASVQAHQSHHDTVHGAVNALAGGTAGQVWQKTSSADYAASWATPGYGGGDYFRSGYYSFPFAFTGSLTAGTLVQDRLYFVPLLVPVRRSFDRIGVNVTTGAAGSSLHLGVYDSANGVPTNLISDAGTVASTGIGAAQITVSWTLDPGLKWLAYAAQGGAPSVNQFTTNMVTPYVGTATVPPTSAAAANCYYSGATVSGALPSTASSLTAWQTAATIALRAA